LFVVTAEQYWNPVTSLPPVCHRRHLKFCPTIAICKPQLQRKGGRHETSVSHEPNRENPQGMNHRSPGFRQGKQRPTLALDQLLRGNRCLD